MAKRKSIVGNPKLAVGYIRVSTDDQALGLEAQLAALEAWALRQGVTLAAVYRDEFVSGATPIDKRQGLLDALEALRTHGAGVLVAAKRDRLARDIMVTAAIEHGARSLGAVVRTADGASDGDGPENAMLRGMLDLFAAYERAIIGVRTKAALARKKARGERLGKARFGVRLVPGATKDDLFLALPHEAEVAVATRIRELQTAGASIADIVRTLAASGTLSRAGKPFGRTQVVRILGHSA